MEFTEVFNELREYARIIRNEKTTSANTALRIGDMYLSIIDAMEQVSKGNDLFSLRTDDNGSQYIHTPYALASDSTLSSLGVGSSEGGGVSYNRLDSWDSYTADKAGYVLSAALGWDLKTRLDNLDLGDFDLSGYLTKSEAQNTYATIESLNSYATKTWVSDNYINKDTSSIYIQKFENNVFKGGLLLGSTSVMGLTPYESESWILDNATGNATFNGKLEVGSWSSNPLIALLSGNTPYVYLSKSSSAFTGAANIYEGNADTGFLRIGLSTDNIITYDSSGKQTAKISTSSGEASFKSLKVNDVVIGSLAFKNNLVASDIPSLSWNKITSDKPTTLDGYGITDALPLIGGEISGNLTVGEWLAVQDIIEARKGLEVSKTIRGIADNDDEVWSIDNSGAASLDSIKIGSSPSIYKADNNALVIAKNGVTYKESTKGNTLQVISQGAVGIDWSTAIIAHGGEAYNVVGSGVGLSLGGYVKGSYANAPIGRGVGIAAVSESTWYNVTGLAFYTNHGVSNDADQFTEKIRLTAYGSLIPKYNTSQVLGNRDNRWSYVYSANGDFSGSVTIGDAKIWWDATNQVLRTDKSFASDKTISSLGVGTESGSGGTGGYASLDNVASDVLPSANNTFTIGNSSRLWKAVYANSLYFGTTNVGESISSLQSGLSTANGNIGTLNTRVTNIEGVYAKKATTLDGYGITDALPLSGGTIDGNIQIGKDDNQDLKSINFYRGGIVGFVGSAVNTMQIGVGNSYLNVGSEFTFVDNGTKRTVIHSGNIGSQSVASALRMTTVLGHVDGTNIHDLNTVIGGGDVYNYGSFSYWENAPTGMLYGRVWNLTGSYASNVINGQLAWDIDHNSTTDTTHGLWWRAIQNADRVSYAKWHQIAFTDSNVASASNINNTSPILVSANESDEIKGIVYPSVNTTTGLNNNYAAIHNGLYFRWYYSHWLIANNRSSDTESNGFGFWFSDSGNTYTMKAMISNDGIIYSSGGFSGGLYGNATSATKLSTARTIWGQSFDGSGDVDGNIKITSGGLYLDSDRYVWGKDKSNNTLSLIGMGTSDTLNIGWGSANASHATYLFGKGITMYYDTSNIGFVLNSSGNVTIGSSDLATTNYKLYVNGDSYVNGALTLKNNNNLLFLNSSSEALGAFTLTNTNDLLLGWGTAGKNYNTYIDGYNVYLRYGTYHTIGIWLKSTGDVEISKNITVSGDTSLSSYLTVQGKAELQSGLDVIGLIQGLDSVGGDTTWKITSDGAATVKNITVGSNERIHGAGNSFYIGNASNAGWVGMQDICSQDALGDSKWSIRTDGRASFGSTLKVAGATTLSSTLGVTGVATFNSNIKAKGYIYFGTNDEAWIYWDAGKKVLRTNVSFASDKTVSSLGVGTESGGGGSADWGSVPTDIVPLYHDTYNLGSDDSWWSELYVNNIQSSVIFMGGGKVATESWVSNRGYMTNSAVKSYVSQEINTFSEEHLGTAASYGVTTSVTSGSSSLVTSGGVYAYALAKAGGTITGTFTVHPSLGNTDDGYITVDKYGTLNGYGFGSQNWYIDCGGYAEFVEVTQASDINLKNILGNTRLSLGTMANAPLVIFNWKNKVNKKHHVGTIAQYWEDALPEVVTTTHNDTLALAYGELGVAMGISLATHLTETNDEVSKLKKRVEELENENKRLQERVDALVA